VTLDRQPLLDDRGLTGADWCLQHARLVDEWLAALFNAASHSASGVALVAIGGYGRAELCPSSDIDIMLLHDKRVDVGDVADRLWYPIWDSGLKLGHSVCTVRQALQLAGDDLDTATALLTPRHIAGDERLTAELTERAVAQWQNGARRWLDELGRRVDARHANAGEVAFLLEPDLKEGRGGMRDVHALKWAEAARRVLFANDAAALETGYAVLLDARVELQRASGRALNVLTHEDRLAVAKALGHPSPDALMLDIAEAARAIAWMSDDTWRRTRSGLVGPRGRGARSARVLAAGVVERDGEIHCEASTATDADPWLALRIGAVAAQHDLPIERATLDRLRDRHDVLPTPWPTEARTLFVDLLLAGRPAIGVIEALDHHGVWENFVPEWPNVRARPQHNPYHRFTVDRHLLEAVSNAAELAARVERPDLLVLAALVHDLGKVGTGNHTTVGMDIASSIGDRVSLPPEDIEVLMLLVRDHLLLNDVASRRDLDDVTTIDLVSNAVGSVSQLHLLAALTEADAKATGPAAWSSWKADLVGDLVARVKAHLRGEPLPRATELIRSDEPDLASLAGGGHRILAERDTVTVVAADRPGLFCRVAGVLALRGLDVLEAAAYSTPNGQAVSRFRVVDRLRDETPWTAVIEDLGRALEGRLAIQARLAERARSHGRRRVLRTIDHAAVTFDNGASNEATVIDVEAPDAIGMLYRITRALTDLDLDIRSAKVQTLGAHVVDAFYVRDRTGQKVVDNSTLAEIERAVLYAVQEGINALDGG
jgi:[protein-PII] uridylyltransferase